MSSETDPKSDEALLGSLPRPKALERVDSDISRRSALDRVASPFRAAYAHVHAVHGKLSSARDRYTKERCRIIAEDTAEGAW